MRVQLLDNVSKKSCAQLVLVNTRIPRRIHLHMDMCYFDVVHNFARAALRNAVCCATGGRLESVRTNDTVTRFSESRACGMKKKNKNWREIPFLNFTRDLLDQWLVVMISRCCAMEWNKKKKAFCFHF